MKKTKVFLATALTAGTLITAGTNSVSAATIIYLDGAVSNLSDALVEGNSNFVRNADGTYSSTWEKETGKTASGQPVDMNVATKYGYNVAVSTEAPTTSAPVTSAETTPEDTTAAPENTTVAETEATVSAPVTTTAVSDSTTVSNTNSKVLPSTGDELTSVSLFGFTLTALGTTLFARRKH